MALNKVTIGRRWFYSHAFFTLEYIFDVYPKEGFLRNLQEEGVDIFSFASRTYIHDRMDKKYSFSKDIENTALLRIVSYEDWWENTIRKKERQSVKKAEKKGVEIRATEINYDFIKGVQKIYNETPFREGRRYSGYSQRFQDLQSKFSDIGDSDVLGAYFEGELIGLLWLTYGDRAAMFRSFVSQIKHRDKCPNNALISEAVRRCDERHIQFLVYGDKYGFLPSLDRFRESQGFQKFPLPRYSLALTSVGQLSIKLGLHRKIEYNLPLPIERALIRLYNRASRMIPGSIWYKLGEE
jgi:hypothetical protein